MMTDTIEMAPVFPSKKYPLVEQVYSGRPGCACGCRGNYSTNPNTINQIVEKLALAEEIHVTPGLHGELIFFGDVGARTYTVYARRP
jgi:hypothetical protein